MGLKEVLEKMKLVEVEAGETGVPPEPVSAPRPVSSPVRRPAPSSSAQGIDDVLRTLPAKPRLDERAVAPAGSGVAGATIPDFPSIYKASGITDPPHGYSAYKVLEIFSSPDFASLDSKAKAAALAGFLKMNPSGPVPIRDVIQDAVLRDQALDGFEEFLKKKLDERKAGIDRDNAALQDEIDVLMKKNKETMEANRHGLEGEIQRFADWQARKRIEERRLFDAVAPFVEQNPVSVGGSGGTAPPSGTKKTS